MVLTIDVGNSNIVFGVYNGEKLMFISRISSNTERTGCELAVQIKTILSIYNTDPKDIEGTIISSVAPYVTEILSEAIELLFSQKPFIVAPGIKTGINIRIDNPAQLGSDLLVDSVAAACCYPKPVIVIDMGTATTFGVVTEDDSMIGGAILPGVKISLDALSDKTAQLPHISLEAPQKTIASNTIDCMRSGVIFGNAAMIDGMVDRIENELGRKCTVVATGGLSREIIKHTKKDVIYNENLLLEGLYILYKKNIH